MTSRKRDKAEVLQTFGDFAAIRSTPWKAQSQEPYLVLCLEFGNGFPGNKITRWIKLKALRLAVIRTAINQATEKFEQGKLSQENLEKVLDYLFAEMHRRINKQ